MIYTDVGPADFVRIRRHPQPEVGPLGAGGPAVVGGFIDGEAKRVL
jgi:hypothetical protein